MAVPVCPHTMGGDTHRQACGGQHIGMSVCAERKSGKLALV